MKLLTAFMLLASICTSAFARPNEYVCVKNDGLYVAYVSAKIWDNTSQRSFFESKEGLLVGQKWCTNNFDAPKGDYIDIKVTHYTGFETLETCKYDKVTDRRLIVANGTTYNYWCHDTKFE